jgi:CRP-like cAMP-binding protein
MALLSPATVSDNQVLAHLSLVQRNSYATEPIVNHKSGALIQSAGEPIVEYVFPLSGLISLTMDTDDGHTIEVAIVGAEGVVGISRLLGDLNSQWSAVVQVPGDMLHVAARDLERHGSPESLHLMVDRCAASLMVEIAQSAACNQLHTVEQRTARWLLHATDRARTTDLELTHEFVSQMLGVGRPYVTTVLGLFERAQLIVGHRGRICVTDPDGLRALTCECYQIVRDSSPQYD